MRPAALSRRYNRSTVGRWNDLPHSSTDCDRDRSLIALPAAPTGDRSRPSQFETRLPTHHIAKVLGVVGKNKYIDSVNENNQLECINKPKTCVLSVPSNYRRQRLGNGSQRSATRRCGGGGSFDATGQGLGGRHPGRHPEASGAVRALPADHIRADLPADDVPRHVLGHLCVYRCHRDAQVKLMAI